MVRLPFRSGLARASDAAVLLFKIACAVLVLGAPALRGQPYRPAVPSREASRNAKLGGAAWRISAATLPTNLSVDTASREEVRLFYRAVYPASENVPMQWSGDYAQADAVLAAGDTAAAFKEAVKLRVNFFRALAGVPSDVVFDESYNQKAQLAALMMSANQQLSHTPPSNWIFYTADGATAAGSSNLALGVAGPDAVDGYIADPGSNNAAAGHRRWILYPQTLTMGTGDVAGDDTRSPANALWVVDGQFGAPRPAVRDTFVAWPSEGYVPYQLVYPRWSFSYPNADFSAATVTMTRGGAPVPVELEPVANGYGENTLVWRYDGLDGSSDEPHARPAQDTPYDVTISNVRIGGQSQGFEYTVIVFDPDVPGEESTDVTVSGPATAVLNASQTYEVDGLYYASGFQWRRLTRAAYSAVEGAENGTSQVVVASTGSYSVVSSAVKAAGNASFHLAHPTPEEQSLQLNAIFVGSVDAQLSFQSRLGLASDDQIARVQVSVDEGASWRDVYTQAGDDGAGEDSFTNRVISLPDLANRTFLLRFAYTFDGSSYYPGTGNGVGWYIDDIALTGVETVSAQPASATEDGNQFAFTPTAAGSCALQARGVFFGEYPLEWGPLFSVEVSGDPAEAPVFTEQPASQVVAAGSNVTFHVAASGLPAPTFQWRKNGTAIAGATGDSLVLLHVQSSDAGSYSVVASNSAGSVVSQTATLTIDAGPAAPEIVTPPASVDAVRGETVTLTVVATGHPSPAYQWKKDGVSVPGATGSALILSDVQAGSAGTYTVVASNDQGSVTSTGAVVTVSDPVVLTAQPASQTVPGGSSITLRVTATGSNLSYHWFTGSSGDTSAPIPGATGPSYTTERLSATTRFWVRVSSPAEQVDSQTALITVSGAPRLFFGNIGLSGGSFGLFVRADGSAVFVGSLSAGEVIDHDGVVIADDGSFAFEDGELGIVSGTIAGNGISGTIGSLSFTGTTVAGSGTTTALAGRYDAALLNTGDGQVRVLAGSAGTAYVLIKANGESSGGAIALGADGRLKGTLDDGRTVDLVIDASTARVSGKTNYAGATWTVRGQREDVIALRRLENISVRAQVRQGDEIMVAGFVINGAGTKHVLVRGIGPALTQFGVGGALADPVVSVHRQNGPSSVLIAENDDWHDAANAAEIAAASATLGAFGLAADARDSALLLELPAGAYTAHVSGVGGATGAGLVEVYDADAAAGVIPSANLVNISMRGKAGPGADVVIAGFVVSGNAPKRLLIRAVGPELSDFNVSGVLANPLLTLFQSGVDSPIASNDSWSDGPEAAAIQAAASQVGAFPLTDGSKSAALLIWLDPGIYTAQASSRDATSGVAIVEVYEVP